MINNKKDPKFTITTLDTPERLVTESDRFIVVAVPEGFPLPVLQGVKQLDGYTINQAIELIMNLPRPLAATAVLYLKNGDLYHICSPRVVPYDHSGKMN